MGLAIKLIGIVTIVTVIMINDSDRTTGRPLATDLANSELGLWLPAGIIFIVDLFAFERGMIWLAWINVATVDVLGHRPVMRDEVTVRAVVVKRMQLVFVFSFFVKKSLLFECADVPLLVSGFD